MKSLLPCKAIYTAYYVFQQFGRISRRGMDWVKYVQRHLVLDFLISMTVSNFYTVMRKLDKSTKVHTAFPFLSSQVTE